MSDSERHERHDDTTSPPFPSLLAAAIQVNELMMTYIKAGFSREEAFTLIRDMMAQRAGGKE